MHKELRDKIKRATEASAIEKPDFVELLKLIDQHYDKMEATITQSLTNATPIEAIFDSVTEALLSVSESGIVCSCNKVCSHYFGLTRDQLIGSKIDIFCSCPAQTERFVNAGWTKGRPDVVDQRSSSMRTLRLTHSIGSSPKSRVASIKA